MQNLNKASSEYAFELLSSPLYPLAKKFYKAARYHSNIGREDEVYVVRDLMQSSRIIAALKLVKLDQYLMLRSMVVAPAYRRTGAGSFMLENLAKVLQTRECWCFPFDELECFYSLISFRRYAPEDCPNVIRLKYQQYSSQGKKIFIMKRD